MHFSITEVSCLLNVWLKNSWIWRREVSIFRVASLYTPSGAGGDTPSGAGGDTPFIVGRSLGERTEGAGGVERMGLPSRCIIQKFQIDITKMPRILQEDSWHHYKIRI